MAGVFLCVGNAFCSIDIGIVVRDGEKPDSHFDSGVNDCLHSHRGVFNVMGRPKRMDMEVRIEKLRPIIYGLNDVVSDCHAPKLLIEK